MALISTLDRTGSTFPSRASNVKVPYVIEFELDFAKALVAKGSALAAADIIEVLTLPAGAVVLDVGAEVKTVADSTTLTLHVGTGADADEWVVSQDGKVLGYAPDLDSAPVINSYPTGDTIDVTLATLTGTLTSGVYRVWALIYDSTDAKAPGIAQLKS